VTQAGGLEGIAEATAKFVQGAVFELSDSGLILARCNSPLGEQLELDGSRDSIVAARTTSDHVVMLTQTCDLQRTTRDSLFFQISPVQVVAESQAHAIGRGRSPGWVGLPWHAEGAVADLSQITTVDRSVLLGPPISSRPRTPQEEFHFAESVSRHFSRAALPDSIAIALRPLLTRMRDRNDKASEEGMCIREVASIRVEANPGFDDAEPDVNVIFVLDEDDLASLPRDVELDMDLIDSLANQPDRAVVARQAFYETDALLKRSAWLALVEQWLAPCKEAVESQSLALGSLSGEVCNGEELSFARSRNAPEIDLAYLTSREQQ
jgi:hypothetical protein